jgi:hypothetical protein
MPVPVPAFPPTAARVRPRLSRTLAAARWPEYRALLDAALSAGYRVVSLETWLAEPAGATVATLVLRHDVDQHPRSVLEMLRIEADLGLRSTWYFRWRTAHPAVVNAVREKGGAVGLHYETLSRHVLEAGLDRDQVDEAVIARCRETLRAEIAAFRARFGRLESICPHGDSRVGFVSNAVLLPPEGASALGVRWDGNQAMRGRGLRYWLTDRSAPEGRWKDGVDPHGLLLAGTTPILCLTHPNNWASGVSLWGDRLLSRALRGRAQAPARSRPVHTGTDSPPLRDG